MSSLDVNQVNLVKNREQWQAVLRLTFEFQKKLTTSYVKLAYKKLPAA
jgi:hypothetical protein